jgi:phosphate acetyltransferase
MEKIPHKERLAEKPAMETVYERARDAHATIILAEADDNRVREAADIIQEKGLATLILLTDSSFSQMTSDEQERLISVLQQSLAKKNLSTEEARSKLASDTKYLAATMVRAGKADGFVGGNKSETAETIRPAVHVIGTPNGYASSFFVMRHNDRNLFFADCGFNVDPNALELARIAYDTAENVRSLGIVPKVAFLSFSTGASLNHPHIEKLREAIMHIRQLDENLAVAETELQFDAAFVPEVAAKKAPLSSVAGLVNVFIFPDLNSGNTAYKIAQRMGGAQAVGPIFQGLNAPVNDLSRGCSTQDIVDVVAFTAMQVGAKKNAHTN